MRVRALTSELAAPPSWREALVALLGAVLLVFALGRLTNRLEPSAFFYDEQVYLKLAIEGAGAVKPVTAPFAYRPGTTALVGAIARLAKVPPARAYAGLAAVALPLFLLCLYALGRAYTPSRWRAAVATLLVALSYSAVKRVVFNPIGPDALGLLLVAAAGLLAARRRYLWLAVVTTVGVTCREFVIVPAVAVALADRARLGWRAPKSPWPLVPVVGALAAALAVRLAVGATASAQHVDPFAPHTWRHALQVLDGRWLVNATGAALAFLWPLACVPWRRGADEPEPGRLPAWVGAYGALLFLVTLFAGTNFTWFAGYFAPFLVVAWVVKGPPRAPGLDLALVLLVVVVNRTLEPIPQPRDFPAYVAFMSFHAADLDLHTGVRLLVIGAAVVTYRALAALGRERAP